jgi:hypothetical protein
MTHTKNHEKNPKRQPRGSYAVGYARPPTHSRFQPGQSGNPRGRRKGVRNFATDVKETLQIPVRVKGEKARKISTQEAALLRLREQALNGDHRALDRLLALASRYNDEAPALTIGNLSTEDEDILKNYEARLARPPSPSAPAEGRNPIPDSIIADTVNDTNASETGTGNKETVS